jgi:hypothetical protein
MALTLAQLFGTNATIDTSGATPKLIIELNDFVPESLNGTAGYTASKVAAAFLRHWLTQTKTLTEDATAGIIARDPFVSLTTRGGIAQRVYGYSVDVYVPDSGATAPDPDLVP